MSARVRQSRALLLRSVDYRDADRVVTLLTEDFGKLSALARGARKSRRRFGGTLQPYVVFNAQLRAGRGELENLEHVSVDRSFLNILRSLDAIGAAGAALASIRERLPDHEPEREVFRAAVGFLEALDGGSPPTESLITLQIRMLARLGFAPTLDQCVGCGKAPPSESAAELDPALGGLVCRACGGGPTLLSAGARRRWVALESTVGFSGERWPDKERDQLRQALAMLDGHHATVSVRERTNAAVPAWGG